MALFLITSAIHTRHGVFSGQERFDQTLATLKSVKAHAPGAHIHILESGAHPLQDDEWQELRQLCDEIHYFGAWPQVQQLAWVNNPDIVKNLTEMTVFGQYLKQLSAAPAQDYRRIFKLSGRYVLTDDFDLYRYESPEFKEKCVFLNRYPSQFSPEVTGGAVFQLMSRLWSFDASLLAALSEIFAQMPGQMRRRLSFGGYIDIEHLLFQMIPQEWVAEVPKIGVGGRLGPTGMWLEE